MSGPINASGNSRPIQDELLCLKQAVNLLNLIELGSPDELDAGEIVTIVRSVRTLIEEVIEALASHFAAQGGAP